MMYTALWQAPDPYLCVKDSVQDRSQFVCGWQPATGANNYKQVRPTAGRYTHS